MDVTRKLSKDGSVHVTDEKFNSVSHLAGAIFALLGLVILIVRAAMVGGPWHVVTLSIYGSFLFLLFLFSTLHHAINGSERVEHVMRVFDYSAIFPLIAGTYTPLCLVVLRNALGWSIFGVIWAVAIAGIALKASIKSMPKWMTNTMYVSMGWLSLAMIIPLFKLLPQGGLIMLALGGVFYTVGSVIYYKEWPNPIPGRFGFHEIWHIFVLAGAACHYFMMLYYIAPYAK